MENKTAQMHKHSDGQNVKSHFSKIPSQKARILQWLKQPGGITNYEMHMRGINAATARISELRRMGHTIHDRYEPFENQFGQTVQIKRYWLAETV
ncbi:hypothetical protein J2T38_000191 [Neisseria perflava]|uniref:helix-turn-helix domain-containing protein n=1 Tax=Neisseria perflava TaxID=33053 RepID=UPI0020A091AF|nr:helix-turn-helix domain-containing protein [Neisseria perflava]MCP1771399.1 hypothetical protein [Neisseria perflava]